MDISNGIGIGVALFVQGCHFHCKNCFNQETWNPDGGKLWTEEIEDKFLKLISKPYVERCSFLGGEPLEAYNINAVLNIMKRIKKMFPTKKIWLYSGYTYEEISSNSKKAEILNYCDILVDGRYVESLKDFALHWAGSSNQRVIDVKKSIFFKQPVLFNKTSTRKIKLSR